ncbi:MAG TPA: hypothetical protein VGO47_05855, partial [Chlamydiales bacterium]|nr:hypothetical protein [Chlamydiales bacterium]
CSSVTAIPPVQVELDLLLSIATGLREISRKPSNLLKRRTIHIQLTRLRAKAKQGMIGGWR